MRSSSTLVYTLLSILNAYILVATVVDGLASVLVMSAMFVERGGDVESAVTPRPIGLHSSTDDGISSAVINNNNTLEPSLLLWKGEMMCLWD